MILQIAKTDGSLQVVKNVIQIDLSFLGNLEDEFAKKDESWNFVSVLYLNEKKEKIRSLIKLDNVLQFVVRGDYDTRK